MKLMIVLAVLTVVYGLGMWKLICEIVADHSVEALRENQSVACISASTICYLTLVFRVIAFAQQGVLPLL